ncbi:hypothetical protein GCM10027517_22100 [Phycicoccus ginsengisoli]
MGSQSSAAPVGARAGRPRFRLRRALVSLAAAAATVVAPLQVMSAQPAAAADPCAAPVNVIACENTKTGTPSSNWAVSGVGDATIQGFATSMSVQAGDTVHFKIKTTANSYHLDVLRMGYYQGNGARMIQAGVKPTATLPQTQPNCAVINDGTGMVDCGNWAESASWTVPSTAVSGVYMVHLVRDDTGGSSMMVFVVRNDASHSDVLFQTSDQTWQAYNTYGGNSLYQCTLTNCPPNSLASYTGASKVSYNRPFHSAADDSGRSWLMYAEYPMIRFMEANGYDVSYTSGVDMSQSSAAPLLLNHKTFMSVGHDEYWSGQQRANVENARDHGVNLAFFSGNEVFWKTRFESSYDGTSTANRTLVCYKDTHYDVQVDPVAWTGTWQDPRFSPPSDGGRPQNALTGQLFVTNSGTTDIQVPAAFSKLRFWRNTAVSRLTSGQTATLGAGLGTLGYEWDADVDNGFRPAGAFRLSATTYNSSQVFTDYGTTTKDNQSATHNMTLYRAPSGALVFGSGTVQWSFGLGQSGSAADVTMQQATVNLFADMGMQPYALLSGLTTASTSTDTMAPTSVVSSPAANATVGDGAKVTVSGTASDSGGGVVAGVEVSTDGGTTWHPATGTTSWTYSWTAHGSPTTTIRTRAVDDSGNMETPGAGTTVNVGCTCSIWGPAFTPTLADSGSATGTEVGVKFKSEASGVITGIRFYKSAKNTGTHVGNLWTSSGTKLASATFTGETASGWQQVTFATPVAINANSVYVASYYAPVGHTASDDDYFYPNPSPTPYVYSTVDSAPLHALRDVNGTVNGVYKTGSSSAFPTSSSTATNYWVDVMYSPTTGPATAPGAPTAVTATPGNASAVVSWTAPSDGGSAITSYTVTPYVGTTAQPSTTVTGVTADPSATVNGLTNGTAYTFEVTATNSVGTGPASAASNAVTPVATVCSPCTIWSAATVPNTPDQNDPNADELGTKFTADINGYVTGVRFYKAPLNTGTHIGNLWTASGARMATVTFTNETASGWQQATFSSPVAITAGQVYVVSYYAPNGHYAADTGYFAASGVDSPPLHALKDGVSGGNGVYKYSAGSTFPTNTYQSEGYYVDVMFTTGATSTAPSAPTGVTATAGDGSATVSWSAPSDGGSAITSYTVTPYVGTTAQTPVSVGGNPPATTATVTGLTNGTAYTFKVSATNAIGTGPQSSATSAVTPTGAATAPSTPTGVTAKAGDGSATLTWTAPYNGGSAITSYTVTPYVGSTKQAAVTVTGNPPATTATVTGLTNGTAYTFTVSATNALGTSSESSPSAAVTPAPPATVPGAPSGVSAVAGNASAVVSWSAPSSDGGAAISSYTVTPYAGSVAGTPVVVSGSPPATSATVSGLTNGTAYTFTVSATNSVGTGPASAASAAVTPSAPSCSPCSIWSVSSAPVTASVSDPSSVELGVKFKADVSGSVTGIRFYKGSGNTGTHVGSLWTSSGTKLASATFSGESATGWQTVTFASPVAVTAGTVYVASYFAPAGGYAADNGGLSAGVDNGVLHALADGVSGGNGVYAYGSSSTFPSNSYQGTNYWVDVVFRTVAATAPGAPNGVTASAGNASATVTWTAPSDGGATITSYMVTPWAGSTAGTPVTVTGSPAPTRATVSGLTNGTAYTFTVMATNSVGTGPASAPSAAVTPVATTSCTSCTIWPSTAVPANPSDSDTSSIEVGVRFSSDVDGTVTGIRFYKGTGNTGTHVGSLWSTTGTKLASATFVSESASGWQQANFASPVAVTAGTVYVASYLAPSGGYAADGGTLASAVDSPPLHALKDGSSGANGLYTYASTSTFPTNTFNSTNYWVDVVFSNAAATAPSAPTSVSATAGDKSATVTWGVPSTGGSAITSYTVTPWAGTTAGTPVPVTGNPPAATATVTGLTNGTTYTFTVTATNAVGTSPASTPSNAVTPAAPSTTCSACTLWSSNAVPVTASAADTSSLTVGVKFKSDVAGWVKGIRFYKGSGNTGTHVGALWTTSGTKLASATFTGESATGWQQVTFASPVAITAGTVYVASYLAPNGRYASDSSYFANAGVDNAPLHALKNGVSGGNGVYSYGSTMTFPSNSYKSTNYWVDVVFTTSAAAAPGAPSGVSAVAGNASAVVSWSAPSSDGGAAISSYTVTPYAGSVAGTPVVVSGSPPATSATVSGLTNGTAYTFTVSATNSVGTGPASAASAAVTPSAPSCSPCSIWSVSSAPVTASVSDPSSVELGVKFKADVSGSVTGIRFYKGSGNTGTHVGSLWTSSGTKLASATFSGESATGWQTVTFASPVAVTAGTVYVASYFAPAGGYAADNGGLSAGVDNGVLHALADGVSGGNGVYAYGSSSTFPSNSYQGTNYWVDILFTAN